MTWKTSKHWAHRQPTRWTRAEAWRRQIHTVNCDRGARAAVYRGTVDVCCDTQYTAQVEPWDTLGCATKVIPAGKHVTLEAAQEAAWAAALAWARDRGYKETP